MDINWLNAAKETFQVDDSEHTAIQKMDVVRPAKEPDYIIEKLICTLSFPEQTFNTSFGTYTADNKRSIRTNKSITVDACELGGSYSIRRDPITGAVNAEDVKNAYSGVPAFIDDLVFHYKEENGLDANSEVVYKVKFDVENLEHGSDIF